MKKTDRNNGVPKKSNRNSAVKKSVANSRGTAHKYAQGSKRGTAKGAGHTPSKGTGNRSAQSAGKKSTQTRPKRVGTAVERRQSRAAYSGDKRAEVYGENSQEIQWFPGHMTRTRRRIQSDLKLVDAVAEIIDARLPYSSRNPDLLEIIGTKPHVILMNKCDLADTGATKLWTEYFKTQGVTAVELDCKTG